MSLTEEAELRLKRDFAWEATKQDIDQMRRDATAWRDADHLNVLRLVGYQFCARLTGGRQGWSSIFNRFSPKLMALRAD